MEAKVIGDVNQLRFLLENLIDEALTVREDGVIRLQARQDNEYIRFLFTDTVSYTHLITCMARGKHVFAIFCMLPAISSVISLT